jgi:hypothetical protein
VLKLLLTRGYAIRHVACCEINNTTPRRALILGNAIWLAKQMNLILSQPPTSYSTNVR